MKNESLPDELANRTPQLLGETVPNLDLDHDDIHRDQALCTCGCQAVLTDLRDHTETQSICTNCGAVFLPDICTACGRDCRNASSRVFHVRCIECHS